MWLIHFSEIEDRENEGGKKTQIIKESVKFFQNLKPWVSNFLFLFLQF